MPSIELNDAELVTIYLDDAYTESSLPPPPPTVRNTAIPVIREPSTGDEEFVSVQSYNDVDNFIDRHYDVSYLQQIESSVALVEAELALFNGRGSLIVTGVEQLAQRFLLFLLTEVGSIPTEPTIGSSLITRIRTGRVRSVVDADYAFYFALDEITDQLVEDEPDDLPDDQKFLRAELLGAAFVDSKITYDIRVTSVAGDSREIIAPVSVVVRS